MKNCIQKDVKALNNGFGCSLSVAAVNGCLSMSILLNKTACFPVAFAHFVLLEATVKYSICASLSFLHPKVCPLKYLFFSFTQVVISNMLQVLYHLFCKQLHNHNGYGTNRSFPPCTVHPLTPPIGLFHLVFCSELTLNVKQGKLSKGNKEKFLDGNRSEEVFQLSGAKCHDEYIHIV